MQKRYEHKHDTIDGDTQPSLIKKRENEGWELVCCQFENGFYELYWKRPIVDSVIPNIMQESDSERLLADYHKWLDLYKLTEMSPQDAAKEYLRRKSANGA